MSVAVIIPLFNGGPWIREALDSVLAQEAVPAEIVVVDDGSTDGSPDLVRGYPTVRLLANTEKGSSVARNVGLAHTRSPFVAFLDQDDVWHPSHLRLLCEAFSVNPEANTVIATASAFSQGAPHYNVHPVDTVEFDPWTRFPFTIGVDGPSLALMRRVDIEAMGNWDPSATFMADALLFLKLSVFRPLLRITGCTVGKRVHAQSRWLLAREWGSRYLLDRHRVMASALQPFRDKRARQSMLTVYERRLESLLTLSHLHDALAARNMRNIPTIAHQLEQEFSDESPELVQHAFYCLLGAIFPIYDSDSLGCERDQVLADLASAWPKHAPRTLCAIEELIGKPPLLS